MVEMNKAISGIKQIHSRALIEHCDPYPKNIQIVPAKSGIPERVVWTDFDVAITYPDSSHIREENRRWFDIEVACVEDAGKLVGAPDDHNRLLVLP